MMSQYQAKQPLAVAIGFFDGVHRGHQAVFSTLLSITSAQHWHSGVLTFPNHPRSFLTQQTVPLLTTCEEKLTRIHNLGVEEAHVLDFTTDLQRLEASAFAQHILVEQLHVAHVVVGHDFHFGAQRSGNPTLLQALGVALGFGVTVVPACCLDNGQEVSSRMIRENLRQYRLTEANTMLGYAYSLTGQVLPGEQLGRQLGFPTANIKAPIDRLLPGRGVYAVMVHVADHTYHGMCNVGTRPTVKGAEALSMCVEVHILDAADMALDALYGMSLTLEFHHFIREEIYFSNLDDLKNQLSIDRETISAVFSADRFPGA